MSKVSECVEAGGQTTCVPGKFQRSWGFQITIKIGVEDISNFQKKSTFAQFSTGSSVHGVGQG
jgi:hypothetical protein